MKTIIYTIVILTFSLFTVTVAQEKSDISESNKINNVLAPQAPPPAVYIKAPNNGVGLFLRALLDDNNQEFGTIDFAPLQNGPAATADIKFKLWKTPNQELIYSGDFEATEKIKTQTFQMTNGAGAGKILTSSSNGTASWQTPSGGSSGSIDGLSDGKSTPGSKSVYLGEASGTNDDSKIGIQNLESKNTGVGFNTLNKNGLVASDFGINNTAVGFEALKNLDNNSADQNTAVGSQSHLNNVSGFQNTAIGAEAMNGYSGGNENIAVGFQALNGGNSSANGLQNVAVGVGALYDNISGDNNIAIGYKAGYAHTGDDELFIQNRTLPSYDPLIWGRFAPGIIRVQINGEDIATTNMFYVNGSAGGTSAWDASSDRRLKRDIRTLENALERVQKLRGVNFEWKNPETHREGVQMGFIAQEAMDIIPEVVNNSTEYMSMMYSPITALLVEAVKEQQTMIDDLKKQNSEMSSKNSNLEERLSKLESLIDGKRFTQAGN